MGGLTALADASGVGTARGAARLPQPEPLRDRRRRRARADALHDVTSGDNNPTGSGPYPATPGYDMATGLGTPIATDGATPASSRSCARARRPACRAARGERVSPPTRRPGAVTITGSGFAAGATRRVRRVAAARVAVPSAAR